MPKHLVHDTPSVEPRQISRWLDESWESEVVAGLPPMLETQAKDLGALVRKRKLVRASDLLRAVLAYVLGMSSFRRLGAWGVLIGLADLSDTAWRKRLWQASAWLLWLLGELLAAPAATWMQDKGRRRVLLIDATRLKQVGGTGDDWRLHSAYELSAGRFSQVSVTDRHQAEQLAHVGLQPGDIAVADQGYGYRRSVALADQQQADVVLRVYPATFPVEEVDGTPIDVFAWLRGKGVGLRSRVVWCAYAGQRFALRLIATALPPQAAQAARTRKRQKAKKQGRTLSAETLLAAGWVVLITTLPPAQWSDEEVLALYRARWQVELLFKRLKQFLHCACIQAKTRKTIEATIRAYLVAWVLQENEATGLRSMLTEIASPSDSAEVCSQLSLWRLEALCVDTLRQQVQGHWTRARLRACLPRLGRFFCESPRRRLLQEGQMRSWLQHKLAPTPYLPACTLQEALAC